jgi:hypothetical protein
MKKAKALADEIIIKAATQLQTDKTKVIADQHFRHSLILAVNHFKSTQQNLNKSETESLELLEKPIHDISCDIIVINEVLYKCVLRITPSWGGWYNPFNNDRGLMANTLYFIYRYFSFLIEKIYRMNLQYLRQHEQQLNELLHIQHVAEQNIQHQEDVVERESQGCANIHGMGQILKDLQEIKTSVGDITINPLTPLECSSNFFKQSLASSDKSISVENKDVVQHPRAENQVLCQII